MKYVAVAVVLLLLLPGVAAGESSVREVTAVEGDAVEPGDTMVVRGVTNRDPDDATIFVEFVEGPDAELMPTGDTDDWGTDGVWEIRVDVPDGVTPGNYTLIADSGDDSSLTRVRIFPPGTVDAADLSNRVSELRVTLGFLRDRNRELNAAVGNLSREHEELEENVEELRRSIDEARARINEVRRTREREREREQPGFTALVGLVALLVVFLLFYARD